MRKTLAIRAENFAARLQIINARKQPLGLIRTRINPFSIVNPPPALAACTGCAMAAFEPTLSPSTTAYPVAGTSTMAGLPSGRSATSWRGKPSVLEIRIGRQILRCPPATQARQRRVAHRFAQFAHGCVVAAAVLVNPVDRRTGNDVVKLIKQNKFPGAIQRGAMQRDRLSSGPLTS